MKFPKFLLLFLIIGLSFTQIIAQNGNHDNHIREIENNLLPQIAVEGEAISSWNIADRMAFHAVPGVSIAFFDDGKIQWTRAYGHLSVDRLRKVDEKTLFQAASISKPVAALGALTLVENGKLDLDKNVNSYLKTWRIPSNKFTESNAITFRNLVTHTGGLTVHGFRGYASTEKVPSTIEVLNGEKPANSDAILTDTFPGSIWRYSGGGYTVGQLAISDISGQAFDDFMKEHVLEPIEMTRSTYTQPLPEVMRDNVAIGHRGNGVQVEGLWHTYPEQAAAGLWTTPSDLAKMAIAIQNAYNKSEDEVIEPTTAKAMLTKHLGDWGLGFGLNGEADSLTFGHGGANEGYRCNLFAFANQGQGVAIMTNGDNGGALYMEILRSMSKTYGWNTYHTQLKKTIELSEDELSKFEGLYEFGPNKEIKLRLSISDGHLFAHQIWNDIKYQVFPEAQLRFFAGTDGTPFEFTVDQQGKVEKMIADGQFEMKKIE
ncbi:MAG: serine hydrolase [Bacteroidia bacterium]|nr:serine hydrolase [Bacteroidia bacterium]